MFYIPLNQLPKEKVNLYKYEATGLIDGYFILKKIDGDTIVFDSSVLNAAERRLAENYIPPIIALVAVKGSDMYQAFALNKGTMQAIIDEHKYIVTLMKDDFNNNENSYFAAGLVKID